MSSLSKNKDELTLDDILTSVRTYIEDEEQIAVIEYLDNGAIECFIMENGKKFSNRKT